MALIIHHHFIFDFQIYYVNFPWEVYLPANALLELILKYVCFLEDMPIDSSREEPRSGWQGYIRLGLNVSTKNCQYESSKCG